MFEFQFTRSLTARLVALSLAAAVSPIAGAQTLKIDDGTPGYALSYGLPDDFCWLNHLTAGGAVTLTSVEAMFGDAPDGTPVTLCVWRDLGGNGDPSQALLLTQVASAVRNSGQQTLALYPIPPTQVSGSFFVGAFLTTDGSFSPASMDPHTPTLGRSWFCTGYGPGTFDPTFLGAWSLWSVSTVGVPGVFMLRANGINGPTAEVFCSAKVNSLGCMPALTLVGAPSATAGGGFTITATSVVSRMSGMFAYSLNGRQMTPFHGGSLCITPPMRRTPIVSSGGSAPGTDCTGVYAFDFNAWIASGSDPLLTAGVVVDGQFWSRDAGFAPPNNFGLTPGVHFGIAP